MTRSHAPKPEAPHPRPPGCGRSILLVDDDPIQLRLSLANLTYAGFKVETANAAEALTMALDLRPAAIMSDVLMGDLDGFALCRIVRSEPALSAVPIVLVSAHFQEEGDRKLALAVGASALVERSPDFKSELEALVRSLTHDVPVQDSAAASELLYFERVASQLTRLLKKSRHSEARYRALIESANDAISVLSPEGVILETNRRLTEILHYPSEQMIGHHIRDFAAAGYEQENVDEFDAAVGGPGAQAHVYPMRRADGKTVYVAYTRSAVDIDSEKFVLSIGRDVTASVENARKLEDSEQNYRSLMENFPDVIWSSNFAGKLTFISPNATRIFGMTPEEILAGGTESVWARLHREDLPHVQEAFEKLTSDKKPFDIEYRWQRPSGEWLWLRCRAAVVHAPNGGDRIDGVASDITARKRLEDQLLQSQKMEAVGLLTGGVAHDFNNILASILANSHFLIEDLGEQDPRRADALEIRESAQRAASLTRQLLAFSRTQVLAPTTLDLNSVVLGVEKMLRRVIGEDVDLSIVAASDLGSVRADPGQIEQVIMNLVVNSRDAMPTGGKVSIETSNVDLDESYAAGHFPLTAGKYVMLAVSDTGCGMDDKTQHRIFEPFFTTKELGKGTGLGLSTSYGIVKQSGGYIWVYSEVGRGTVLKIYLPRVDSPPDVVVRKTDSALVRSGTETILLIEDDQQLRSVVLRILDAKGYRVLPAGNGDEALLISNAHGNGIDLILTDVIMPGRTGPEIVSLLQKDCTLAKTLFMSGYTDHAVLRDDALQIGMSFIQKPFAPEALARKVREVLDEQRNS
jgi:two-component system, cell cycle sensor histidine kinase and response regulator CckA